MSKKTIVFALLIVSIVLCVITLGLSLSQIKDKYKNAIALGDCNDVPNPFKLVSKDNAGSYIICNWASSRSAVRLLYLFIFIILSSLSLFSIVGKSKQLLFVLSIALLVIGAFGIFSFAYDAKAITDSRKYCKSIKDLGNAKCVYDNFNATITFNIFTAISIIATGVFSAIFRNSMFE
ncbi:hypothetical protein DICPUDRAFT_78876 [Dictyostelium purpureum]|uniref:MARVEL domain-containing protein n=1 Tax=Dictyostelium purpureum TaxID=5786 RepID=F0ZKV5_DICPU|nr:uncharacterized protein DICPUDRAFT_78876 [Dictyostelium purpureum]EGC35444.1 hypothetical protein DICPUDRAFT_78876 [Dictyostelium purpureum]|eukprot:XP_003288057.1 hypothetical protein DICPUDRAFT_78876 [Dictyostelium purpureum]